MSHKILTLWGSPGSGKTITSIKLALELTARNKNVVLVFADRMYSPLTEVAPGEKGEKKSLGEILSAPTMSQESILNKCIPLKNNRHLSLLGYGPGENIFHYADYTKERAVEFLVLLRHMVDYVIVDCSTAFVSDTLSTVALEMGDTVFRLTQATTKSLSYYEANLPILASSKFRTERHVKVLSNLRTLQPRSEINEMFGGIHFELEAAPEIEEQLIAGELLLPVKSPKSKPFTRTLAQMADLVEDARPVKVQSDAQKSPHLPKSSPFNLFKRKEA